MLTYIHNLFELLGFIVAIYYYPCLKKSFMKWFLPFLGFVFIGELVEKFLNITVIVNYLIGILESVFYGYIFYQLTRKRRIKKLILFFIPVSVAGYFICFIFYGKDFSYFIPNIIITGFFLATISLAYLYERFADDDDALLFAEPGFWIAVGVCLFYSGVSISLSLYDFILKNDLSIFGVKLYSVTTRILSVILYLCISISIILCKEKKRTLS
ncbi:MAG: hypothetical protein Q8L07_03055 [Sediminibacterium sp.]|nr:hypothetical protein [Sediminibacterium sp.]